MWSFWTQNTESDSELDKNLLEEIDNEHEQESIESTDNVEAPCCHPNYNCSCFWFWGVCLAFYHAYLSYTGCFLMHSALLAEANVNEGMKQLAMVMNIVSFASYIFTECIVLARELYLSSYMQFDGKETSDKKTVRKRILGKLSRRNIKSNSAYN